MVLSTISCFGRLNATNGFVCVPEDYVHFWISLAPVVFLNHSHISIVIFKIYNIYFQNVLQHLPKDAGGLKRWWIRICRRSLHLLKKLKVIFYENSRWLSLPEVKGQPNLGCGWRLKVTACLGNFMKFTPKNVWKCYDWHILHFATKWPPSHKSFGHPIIISELPVDAPNSCVWDSLVDFEISYIRTP